MPDPSQERKRLSRVRRALTDPVFFGELYVRPTDPNWTGPMPRHGREMIAHALRHQNSVTMLPPEFAKPVAETELVLMGDGSRRPLAEVQVGDEVITHLGRPRRVEAVHVQGELEAVEVKTWLGRSATAAPDHPFLTPGGWVAAGDLVPGDHVGTPSRPLIPGRPEATVHEAKLAGYIVGDGCVTGDAAERSMRCSITCYDELEALDIIACAGAMGFGVRRRPENGGDNLAHLSLVGGSRPWAKKVGLAFKGSWAKRVPEFVFTSPPEAIAGFIGAYFACDGCVQGKGSGRQDVQLQFNSVNRPLLEDVQHLLARLGIRSAIREKYAKSTNFSKGKPHLSYRLGVTSQDDVARFVERVPVPGVKAERLRSKGVKRSAFDAAYIPDKVVSVTPAGRVACRCLTVEEDRSFLANDIAVHNTSYISQLLPIWLTISHTARGKLLHGILLAEEEAMAKGNLRVVATNLLENERIATDFVDASGRPIVRKSSKEDVWNDGAIIVERPGASKDPTWVAKGLDSKGIHGRRLHWAIVDDIITPAHANSAAKRQAAQIVFDDVLRERMFEQGHIAVVGNFISPKDLLHDLGGRENWHMVKRPSMHLPGQPSVAPAEKDLLDPDIELLWPEKWSRERLLQRYREGPNRFRRIHLMDPHADGGERLQVEWVRVIKPEETPLAECEFFMSIDPNGGGEGDDLDFGVVTVAAVHATSIDIVESYATRADPGKLAALAGVLYDRWARVGAGVRLVGMSKVSLDRVFATLLEQVRPDLAMIADPVHAPGSKEERLEALGAYAQSGSFRVWEDVWTKQTAAIADRYQEEALVDQWKAFPMGAHDDRLDGIDIVLRSIRTAASRRPVTVRLASVS